MTENWSGSGVSHVISTEQENGSKDTRIHPISRGSGVWTHAQTRQSDSLEEARSTITGGSREKISAEGPNCHRLLALEFRCSCSGGNSEVKKRCVRVLEVSELSTAQHIYEFVSQAKRGRREVGRNGESLIDLGGLVVEEMQVINNCAVDWRKGMMAHVGARVLGRGLVKQWHRQVCVKMASTALIFSALQPVRPALHLSLNQQVVPGRISRGTCSNLLLLRQCATTEPSWGASECADGSIMYKFGSPEQKEAISTANDQLSPKDVEESEELVKGQSAESSTDVEQRQAAPEDHGASDREISRSGSHAVVEEESSYLEVEPSEIAQKLVDLDLGEQKENPTTENGSGRKEVPVDNLYSATSTETTREEPAAVPSDEPKDATSCLFNSGAAMIPHPEKAARGGEDAYFIEGSQWIGVADGVGGWALEGINAGHYARELMWHCAELARQSDKDSDPKTLLVKSFSRTKAMGSTTAVLASVSGQTLNVVNMGDTGFLVVRDGAAVARSTPMQRGFNFPYQIGSVGDDPFLAEVYRVPVEQGDVVILGSDGLFDNLFESEIVKIVSKLVPSRSEPETVARELTTAAHKVGATQEGLSPFAKEAQAVGYSYSGGKMDDVTCVVSIVSSSTSST